MRILKKLFLFLLSLVGVILVVAAFMKKEFAVEREVVINMPKDSVFKFIKFVKNQDQFSTWNKMDPEMKKSYSGSDGEVGFIASWESTNENVGVGEQEIKNITEGQKIDFELRFKEPFESTSNGFMSTESISTSSTKVKWGFSGSMPYPMNIMLAISSDDEMGGKDLQEGLNNLKTLLEKK